MDDHSEYQHVTWVNVWLYTHGSNGDASRPYISPYSDARYPVIIYGEGAMFVVLLITTVPFGFNVTRIFPRDKNMHTCG